MLSLKYSLSIYLVMFFFPLLAVKGQEPLMDELSRLRRLGANVWVKDSVRHISIHHMAASMTRRRWRGTASDLNLLTQIGDINSLRLHVSSEQLGSGEAFPQIAGLTVLSIFTGRWPTELLHNISKCKSLKSLSLAGSHTTTTKELRPIIEMQNLECLSLFDLNIKDDVLLSLAEMQSLRELRVVSFDFTQTGFDYVTQIKSLEKLHFGSVTLDDEALTNLLRLPRLREFSFHRRRVTDSGRKWMRENLPNCTLVEEGN